MTITQLKYFIEVASTENLREASEKIYISQQALSKQIQALEKDIDIQLFERKKQRLHLTEAGKYLFSVWKPLIETIEQEMNHARALQKIKKIRIGVMQSKEISDNVCSAFEQYKREFPNTELEIILEGSNRLIQLFQEKKVDVMIVASVDLQYINGDYNSMKLKNLNFGVICNINHRFKADEPVSLTDLQEEKIFMFENTYIKNVEQNIRADFEKMGIVPKEWRKFRDWENMQLAVCIGQGIGVTFKEYLSEQMNTLLKFCPIIETDDEKCQLMICWKEKELEQFVKLIADMYQ